MRRSIWTAQSIGRALASTTDPRVALCYIVFFVMFAIGSQVLSAGFSSVLTLSAGFQGLGLVLLSLKVHAGGSVAGLSARMLGMYAATFSCRLSSTLWLNGYLPVDRTGDGPYQLCEIVSLLLVLRLLYLTKLGPDRHSYNAKQDTMPCVGLCAFCFVLAVLIHPTLDRKPIFDVLWTAGCYLETVAMLPQLWTMARIGGYVEALTAHFVSLTAAARLLSLLFWYHGFGELANKRTGSNISGVGVIFAHLAQLLISCDFLYLYARSLCLVPKMVLPDMLEAGSSQRDASE